VSHPWITKGIKKAIFVRDKLLSKFIRSRNKNIKSELYTKYTRMFRIGKMTEMKSEI